MWYPNYNNPRRRRRGYGIPFIFPFMILFLSHSFTIFLSTLVLSILIALIIGAFNASQPNGSNSSTYNNMNAQWRNQPQTPYYQPPTPVYQPPAQPEYKPYEQGYQPEQAEYKPGAEAGTTDEYLDYEQPQAQYPDQMPPMQQQ
jgi:hypothetical protein